MLGINELVLENSLSPGITPHDAINQPCYEFSWQEPQSHKSKLTFPLVDYAQHIKETGFSSGTWESHQWRIISGASSRESILHIYMLLQAVYVTKAY